jgi:Ca2+-binding RTX toxin-like protein
MNLEPLEARRLFAVNVVQGYPGFYEIHGTDESDTIDAAINMAEKTVTVNGTTYEGASYVVAYGYGGSDVILVTTVDGAGIIGASVSAGDGNDQIMLGVDGGVWAGDGNDEIYLMDSFRGAAYGEAGNDYIHVSGLTTDARINGGDGNDFIDCAGNQYGLVLEGGAGNDTIIGTDLPDQLYGDDGNDILEGAGGNDMLYARGGDADIVNGGEGEDIAYVDYDDSPDAEQVYWA